MKCESQLEITVRWQGIVIRVERYEDDHDLTLNGKNPFVTVPFEWLLKEVHTLVSICQGEVIVYLLPSMHATLNEIQILDSNRILNLDDELEIRLGPFWFQLRCTKPLKSVFSPLSSSAQAAQ